MQQLWKRLNSASNLWLIGAGAMACTGMAALVPYLAAALVLGAFPDVFGPGLWSNGWFLLAAAVWLPCCAGLALRLLYGHVPDVIDRRPSPMAAGYARERADTAAPDPTA